MSISSVPDVGKHEPESRPGPSPLKKKSIPGDFYLRVMKVGDSALVPRNDLGRGLLRASDEIKAIMSVASSSAKSSLEETSAVIPIMDNDDEEGTIADTETYTLPALDYDDVHDTLPGIPEGCACMEPHRGPRLDAEGHPIFDLDGSRWDDDNVESGL